MRSGVGAMMVGPNFWLGALGAVVMGIAVTGLFFVLSVALVSPPSANRALPVRIYITLFWLLGGLLSLIGLGEPVAATASWGWTYGTRC